MVFILVNQRKKLKIFTLNFYILIPSRMTPVMNHQDSSARIQRVPHTCENLVRALLFLERNSLTTLSRYTFPTLTNNRIIVHQVRLTPTPATTSARARRRVLEEFRFFSGGRSPWVWAPARTPATRARPGRRSRAASKPARVSPRST